MQPSGCNAYIPDNLTPPGSWGADLPPSKPSPTPRLSQAPGSSPPTPPPCHPPQGIRPQSDLSNLANAPSHPPLFAPRGVPTLPPKGALLRRSRAARPGRQTCPCTFPRQKLRRTLCLSQSRGESGEQKSLQTPTHATAGLGGGALGGGGQRDHLLLPRERALTRAVAGSPAPSWRSRVSLGVRPERDSPPRSQAESKQDELIGSRRQQSPPSAFLPQAAFPEQPGSCMLGGKGASRLQLMSCRFPPLAVSGLKKGWAGLRARLKLDPRSYWARPSRCGNNPLLILLFLPPPAPSRPFLLAAFPPPFPVSGQSSCCLERGERKRKKPIWDQLAERGSAGLPGEPGRGTRPLAFPPPFCRIKLEVKGEEKRP